MIERKVRAYWKHRLDSWGGGKLHITPSRHKGHLVIRLRFGPFALALRLNESRALADHLHDLTDELEGNHEHT